MKKYVFVRIIGEYLYIKGKEKSASYKLADSTIIQVGILKKIIQNYTIVLYDNDNSQLQCLSSMLNSLDNFENEQKIYFKKSPVDQYRLTNRNSQPKINVDKRIKFVNLAKLLKQKDKPLSFYAARFDLQKIYYNDNNFESLDEPEKERFLAFEANVVECLYHELMPGIEIRDAIKDRFGIDVSNCSDPQIAEKYFRAKQPYKANKITRDTIRYVAPGYINFASDNLNSLLKELQARSYEVDSQGKLIKEADDHKSVKVNGKVYKLGLGGLHSCEKSISVVPGEDEFLCEVDVTSYYPSIIINNSYYPQSYGAEFLSFYKELYLQRKQLLADGDTIGADIYKLIINNCFGKFGSPHSCLYDLKMLIQTTITGQLALLMLIELLGIYNIEVVSANTDALVIKGKKVDKKKLDNILDLWKNHNSFVFVQLALKSIHLESVNSYVSFLENGAIKSKGAFTKPTIHNTASLEICKKAVFQYLNDGIPVIDTIINQNTKLNNFFGVSYSSNGISMKSNPLGQVVRWYYSTDGEQLTCSKTGRKVCNASSVRVISDIKDSSSDIDYKRYVNESYNLLKKVGVNSNEI